ncbi:MAG: fibronectin type III domain-containing protein [Gammaproteobacteria bacterium]|nr:fibronectin type III domain-containing protein [Gammaproteobacteria bacterium]
MDSAFAGAGLGSGMDLGGLEFPVPTYFANSPSGDYTDWAGNAHQSGTALRKFVDTLSSVPGLAPSTNAGVNNLGQSLPLAAADTASYPGSDYYWIGIVEYTEKMHSDLPKATTLRGYVQIDAAATAAGDCGAKSAGSECYPLTYLDGNAIMVDGKQVYAYAKPHYLGPIILATKGKPVRMKYSNLLPIGKFDPETGKRNGDLFIPVDHTLPGAGFGPDGPDAPMFTENRAEIHLHGGLTPWISDGTPHQWTVPVGDTGAHYKKGQSFQNVPDMVDPGEGSATLYWTNDQSARFMFYHDHTSGLTRLNVYAGEAAGYVLTDPQAETILAAGGLPGEQIPLVIQDKTFVPADIDTQDALWDPMTWGQPGDLWFPHVYETNQDPNQKGGANAVGRWDWGPWFWPVFPAQYALPTGAYGDETTTPEAFMDTSVVNGTAYPTMTVDPKAYRFRILAAGNDRFLNLGFYVAADKNTTNPEDPLNSPGLKLCDGSPNAPTDIEDCTEVKMVPATATPGFPYNWPTDSRAGGVPDPTTVGPVMYQIGNEAGLMPNVSTVKPVPENYDYNRRTATVLNVSQNEDPSQACYPDCHALYLGPAERADVVVDFSQFAGKTLILYNDGPAPNPGFDPRSDYYTGNGDQTDAGGAPSTKPGYGPNTRTVMQIHVRAAAPAAPLDAVALNDALHAAYKAVQDPPVAGQIAYNDALGTTYGDNYASIFTGSANLPKFYATDTPVAGEALRVNSFALSGGGTGYTFMPPVTLAAPPAGGTQAAATAIMDPAHPGIVQGLSLSSAGAGYTAAPTVTFGQVPSRVVVTVRGTGYSQASPPAVTLTDAHDVPVTSVAATATVSATGQVSGVTLAAAGLPQVLAAPLKVTIDPPAGGTQAKATATMSGGGAAAMAIMDRYDLANPDNVSSATTAYDVQNKAIQELFEPFYGRMNATLGVELPFTSALTQTTIPLNYIDPTTETIPQGQVQIWKITHNGVDAHPVHFHLVNVQLINRVGWDGTIKPPEANEVGWKETVKMNPLEDVIVAVKAVAPKTPFGQPRSVRTDDPSQEVGVTTGFTQIDPQTNNPLLVQNRLEDFDNEYVWHCHILGHEENDFMRPFVMDTKASVVAPTAPGTLSATADAQKIDLTWQDPTPATLVEDKPANLGNPMNEIGFMVQMQPITGYNGDEPILDANAWQTVSTAIANTESASIERATLTPNTDYAFRVGAYNSAQQGPMTPYSDPKTSIKPTAWSQALLQLTPPGTFTLTLGTVNSSSVALSWTSSQNATSYQVEDGFAADALADVNASLTDLNSVITGLAANTTYFFDVVAKHGSSIHSNTVSATTDAVPASFEAARAGDVTASAVTLRWANANPNLSALQKVEIARNGDVVATLTGAQILAADTYTDAGLAANAAFSYAVTVTGANGNAFTVSKDVTTAPAIATFTQTHTATSVVLSWTYPANANTAGLNATISRDGTPVASGLTGTTTWTDENVSANSDYAYTVTISGADGTADASLNVTTAPQPVSALQIVNGSLTPWAVSLDWTNDNPNAVTFEVDRTPDMTSTVAAGPYADTSLTPGNAYSYAVTVVGKDGVQKSAPVNINVTAVSLAIADLNAVSAPGKTQVDLTWSNLSFSVDSYSAVRCTGTQTFGTCTSGRTTFSAAAGSPWADTTAAPGTTYTYFAQPVVAGHPGLPYSNAKTLTTLRVPSTPTMAGPNNIQSTSMTIRWNGSSAAVNYTVQQQQCANTVASPCDGNGWTTLNNAATGTSLPTTGLQPATRYSFRVRANAWGSSAFAATPSSATTLVAPVTVSDSFTFPATQSTTNSTQTVSFNIRTNDTPSSASGGTVTVGTLNSVNGGATATLTCAPTSGSCNIALTPVGTGLTPAQRQVQKRGTYTFTYQLNYGGLTSAPATATVTLN